MNYWCIYPDLFTQLLKRLCQTDITVKVKFSADVIKIEVYSLLFNFYVLRWMWYVRYVC